MKHELGKQGNLHAAKVKRYEGGLQRIDACWANLEPAVRDRLRLVRQLFEDGYSAQALLVDAAFFEQIIIKHVWQALQTHFNLTQKAAIRCLLRLKWKDRNGNGYLRRLGHKNIAETLRQIDPKLLDVLKHAKEMRNRYIHGLTVFRADQFAEGIVGYALALNAIHKHFTSHPLALDERKFGVRRTGKKNNEIPNSFLEDDEPEQPWFQVNTLTVLNNEFCRSYSCQAANSL